MTSFYRIEPREDGTVDVVLAPPKIYPMTANGQTDYDISILVVRGLEPLENMEEFVRANYDALCQMAETIYL